MTLLDVVVSLPDIPVGDGYSAGPTIYARRPWAPASDAVVLSGDDVPQGVTTESGHEYLLEVNLAVEVVEVWSEWRAGAVPTAEEATLAVIYYGEHDAYEPPPSPSVVLIDDLRSFVDGRRAEVARTSAAGVELLERLRGQRLDELWLDHDLGGDDTIWPVVEVLERSAFDGQPYDIGVVFIHSANPPGVARLGQTLERWGYHVVAVPGSPHVGYLIQEV